MKYDIAIRVDASASIGSGHLMRCLVLATNFSEAGRVPVFVSKAHKDTIAPMVRARGFDLVEIPVGDEYNGGHIYAKWAGGSPAEDGSFCANLGVENWIVDHYGLDASWGLALRRAAPLSRIAAIDDMQDRKIYCDVLFDPNIRTFEEILLWNNLASGARILSGPEWLPMDPVFLHVSAKRKYRPEIGSVLVNFGGIDNKDATGKTLSALKRVGYKGSVVVVSSPMSPGYDTWRTYAECFENFSLSYGMSPKEIADIYIAADLAFGASGLASWERAVTLLPTALATMAKNQENQHGRMISEGSAFDLGSPDDSLFEQRVEKGIKTLFSVEKRTQISLRAKDMCDGMGLVRVSGVLDRLFWRSGE